MRRWALIWLVFLACPLTGAAQEFVPLVRSYAKDDYRSDSENWDVSPGPDGRIYVGNNRGLLSYDGYSWQLTTLPQNKVARSLLLDGDRLYVGSYQEFGYFSLTDAGVLEYTSLSARLQDYLMQNDEIWRILKVGDKIVFQAFRSWFIWESEQIRGLRSPSFVLFFSASGDNVYAHSEDGGLCRVDLERGLLAPVPGVPFKSQLIQALPLPDGTTLMVTYADGLYLYDGESFTKLRTEADAILAHAQVNRALLGPEGSILVGTRLDGVFSLSMEGKVNWHLSSSNVLPGDTVLGMASGPGSRLWLALNRGVSQVPLEAGLRYVREFQPGIGDIYTAVFQEPYLYLGTSQGLYRSRMEGGRITDLKPCPQVEGYVIELSAHDGQVFCGTNGSTFEIAGQRISRVSPVNGGSCMDEGRIHGREVLVQGTYTQLCVYVKEGGRWVYSHAVSGFMEPLKTLKIDYRGTIWAGHLHEGLYEIRLSPDLRTAESVTVHESLDGENKLPVSVSAFDGRVVFTDGASGFYTYDDLSASLIPYASLNQALSGFPGQSRIVRSEGDNYWFLSAEETALLRWSGDSLHCLDVLPYLLVGGTAVDVGQRICPMPDGKQLILLENALALYESGSGQPADVRLRPGEIRFSNRGRHASDSLMPLSVHNPSLPWEFRNVSFKMLYPRFDSSQGVYFLSRLEGLEQTPQRTEDAPTFSYNYLPSGSFVFHLDAVSFDGRTLSSWSYPFSINPPFYRSAFAWALYGLLGLCFVLWLSWRIASRVKARQEAERAAFRQQMDILEREKLEAEVRLRSKELAATTMNLIHKRELLIRIREELTSQKKALGKDYPDKYYTKITRIIDEQLAGDDDWARFERSFDNIHENFFATLRERYPDLTDTDLRFCAYLHMNISSKDIASLMNISPKGVEAARYRIRKKIQLPSDQSLTAFMIELR